MVQKEDSNHRKLFTGLDLVIITTGIIAIVICIVAYVVVSAWV